MWFKKYIQYALFFYIFMHFKTIIKAGGKWHKLVRQIKTFTIQAKGIYPQITLENSEDIAII